MNRYNSYKDSGIFWIENYPSHWGITPIKNKYFIGRGRVISNDDLKDDGLYPVFSSQTKNNGCLGYINSFDFDDKLITWTTDGANAGTVFLREGKFNCTNVCGTLKPKNNNVKLEFDAYFLKFATQFYKRPDTNGAKIMNNEMAVIITLNPPLQEQEQIVAYLDKKTAIVDTLISSKEKKINILKEKRTALINHVITKGLDPKVKLKDSGIEWIGEIPEHWEVKKLKHICEIIYGISPQETTYNVEGIGIELVNGPVEYSKTDFGYTRSLKWTTDPKKFCKKGSLLFCLRGSTTGRMNLTHMDLSIGRGVCSINSKGVQWFMIYSMFILRIYIQNQISGSTFPSVVKDDVDNFTICNPSILEQQQIVEYLDINTKEIDELISLEQKKIETLKEYRQALISEVVTGKIKVIKD